MFVTSSPDQKIGRVQVMVGFFYFILLFIFSLVNISDEIWETFYMKQQKRMCSIRAVALK
jgi:hypothetical protein